MHRKRRRAPDLLGHNGDVTGDAFSLHDDVSVHAWAMFDLRRRTVVSPGGETFERTFVATPGAVGVVAVTDDDEVVLVRQYRAAFHDSILEIPAGMRDIPGEDPEVTAARELTEETGYSAATFDHVGHMLSSPGVTDSVVEVFLARGLRAGEASPHGPEEDSMEVVHIPFATALEMIDRGEIADSKSVFGLLATARRRASGQW